MWDVLEEVNLCGRGQGFDLVGGGSVVVHVVGAQSAMVTGKVVLVMLSPGVFDNEEGEVANAEGVGLVLTREEEVKVFLRGGGNNEGTCSAFAHW